MDHEQARDIANAAAGKVPQHFPNIRGRVRDAVLHRLGAFIVEEEESIAALNRIYNPEPEPEPEPDAPMTRKEIATDMAALLVIIVVLLTWWEVLSG